MISADLVSFSSSSSSFFFFFFFSGSYHPLLLQAYEILMEEDLRAKYDRGEDVTKEGRDKASQNKGFHKFNFNPDDIKGDRVSYLYLLAHSQMIHFFFFQIK